MRIILATLIGIFLFSGCSATWSGIKEDTSKAVDWTKEKVN